MSFFLFQIFPQFTANVTVNSKGIV